MTIYTIVTYNMNALNVTTQEENYNMLLKLFLYIVFRYFI
jgi:hypothetical protein